MLLVIATPQQSQTPKKQKFVSTGYDGLIPSVTFLLFTIKFKNTCKTHMTESNTITGKRIIV